MILMNCQVVRGQMVSDGVQLRGGRDHPGVRFRAAASGEHFFFLRFIISQVDGTL